jgi:hypothetical protein
VKNVRLLSDELWSRKELLEQDYIESRRSIRTVEEGEVSLEQVGVGMGEVGV